MSSQHAQIDQAPSPRYENWIRAHTDAERAFADRYARLVFAADKHVDDTDLDRHADDGGLIVEPMAGPFDSTGWPPSDANHNDYFNVESGELAVRADAEPNHDDAQGCASASSARGPRGEASSSPGVVPSAATPSSASTSAVADVDACGLPNGLHPVAGASDIAPARYPACGGELTRFLAMFPRREGSFL